MHSHNCRRNMDRLVRIRDWRIVETVDFTRFPVNREGDGHRFLGFTKCDLHQLLGERQDDHRAVLCRIIGPIQRRNMDETSSFRENVLFYNKNAPALTFPLATGKLVELSYVTLLPPLPPYSSGLAPVRLLFVSKHEKFTRRQKFECNESHRHQAGLFYSP